MEREDVTDEMQIEAWNGLLYAISGTYEVLSANESECDILWLIKTHSRPGISAIRLPWPPMATQ